MISNLNDKDFLKEYRCLRMHLAPLLTPRFAELLEDAERRLNPGSVSTNPDNLQTKKRMSKKQKHEQWVSKFYNK